MIILAAVATKLLRVSKRSSRKNLKKKQRNEFFPSLYIKMHKKRERKRRNVENAF